MKARIYKKKLKKMQLVNNAEIPKPRERRGTLLFFLELNNALIRECNKIAKDLENNILYGN